MQQVTQRVWSAAGVLLHQLEKSLDIKPRVPFTTLQLLSLFSL